MVILLIYLTQGEYFALSSVVTYTSLVSIGGSPLRLFVRLTCCAVVHCVCQSKANVSSFCPFR